MNATLLQLQAALANIKQAPKTAGVVDLIVRRPKVGEREVLSAASLDVAQSLIGDSWKDRGRPNLECQLTVMNSRAIAAIAGDRNCWPTAGDQLYVDLDLSAENLPAGTRLRLGEAIIEVTAYPHAGCSKFKARFGPEALKFVNSEKGMYLRLRGLNARIIQPGAVRVGDAIEKLPPLGI